jgi:tetratricopeptide (TPR) repeat protein
MAISPSATFGNPNVAADFVVTLIPVLLSMILYCHNGLLSYAAVAVSLLSGVFLFYTGSRGSGVALGCSVLWMAFLYFSKKYKLKIRAAVTGLSIIAGLFLIVMYTFPSVTNTIRLKALAEYRLIAWRNSVEMIKDQPLSGFGIGNFKIFYPAYSRSAVIDGAIDTTRYLGRAHNDYIQTAVEQGLPGLVLFLLLIGYGVLMTWRLLKKTDDYPQLLIIIGLSGGLIGFMVVAFFSFPLQRSIPPLVLFTYLSIVAMIYNQRLLNKKTWNFKISPGVGVLVFCCLLVTGIAVNRFNWNNVACEKYFSQALSAEKRGQNIAVISAGLRAHAYLAARMDVMLTVGRAYAATGEYVKAIETLEKVVSRYPYNVNALFFLGAAYTNTDQAEKALEILKQALEIKPDFPEVRKIIKLLKSQGKARVSLR